MKKLKCVFLGAAGLLLASCANENLVSNTGNGDGTANVTISLSTPQIQTRVFSNGKTAKDLYYGVYDMTTPNSPQLVEAVSKIGLTDTDKETIDLQKTITLTLLTDHTYRVVFWAQSSPDATGRTNPYSVKFKDTEKAAQPELSVNYKNNENVTIVTANNENYDAFFGIADDFKITGNVTLDVPLYRPFAQINVGTKDFEEAEALGREVKTSTITVPAYTSMDLYTGKILDTDDAQPVTFKSAPIPDNKVETFPVAGYEYLAMTYVLVKEEQELVEVSFDYVGSDDNGASHVRTVGSVPVQRNHRTNIYGQILTSTADLLVRIEPDFPDPDLQPSELEMAAALGGTVVLEDNVTLNEGERITFLKDAVVDLNGKTVTGAPDLDGVFRIENGANVTIKGPGKVAVADNDQDNGIAVWANNGTVTIEGGTYEAKGETSLIYSTGGTIIIKGGSFKVDDEKGRIFTLNLQDNNPDAKIIVMGGVFYNYDPSNSNSEKPTANFVAPGYIVKETQAGDGTTLYAVVPQGNKEAVVEKVGGKVYCLAPALPEGATETQLEGKSAVAVGADGTPVYYNNTVADINRAMEENKEIFLAPNITLESGSHLLRIPQSGITIHGNGASITKGEHDFSIDTSSTNPGAFKYEEGSIININISDLNGVKIWGDVRQKVTFNVNLKNCATIADGIEDGSHSLLMARGQDDAQVEFNATLEDCYVENSQLGLHSTYVGKLVIKNCTFKEVGIPVNYAKKLPGATAEVSVIGCNFIDCGIPKGTTAWDYAAPVRVVDNGGPENMVKLLVDNCTFSGTNQSEWDILLMDYRWDSDTNDYKVWFPIDYPITNCTPASPTVRAE